MEASTDVSDLPEHPWKGKAGVRNVDVLFRTSNDSSLLETPWPPPDLDFELADEEFGIKRNKSSHFLQRTKLSSRETEQMGRSQEAAAHTDGGSTEPGGGGEVEALHPVAQLTACQPAKLSALAC